MDLLEDDDVDQDYIDIYLRKIGRTRYSTSTLQFTNIDDFANESPFSEGKKEKKSSTTKFLLLLIVESANPVSIVKRE